MGLPLRWQHQDNDKGFEEAVRNSTVALSRLKQIFLEDLRSLDAAETTEKQFEDPNWEYKQAYRLGRRAELIQKLSLLSFLDQE